MIYQFRSLTSKILYLHSSLNVNKSLPDRLAEFVAKAHSAKCETLKAHALLLRMCYIQVQQAISVLKNFGIYFFLKRQTTALLFYKHIFLSGEYSTWQHLPLSHCNKTEPT